MFSKPPGNPVTLYSKCNQASDLYQHIELASEIVDGGQDTMDCGRKRLVDFNAVKTQLVLFDQSKSTGDIDVKMDGSVGLSLPVQWLVAVQPCMESQ